MPKEPTRPGYDPTQDIVLDAKTLRGVAHPLRLRLLGALRSEGPQTATQLAAALGESSAATSYHLRTLASYGFVVEAPELGQGRERFWRAAHRSTWFGAPEKDAPERELGEVYYRTVARIYAENLMHWVDEAPDWPQEWLQASTMSDWQLRLTTAQADELKQEVAGLLARWRDDLEARPAAADDGEQRLAMTIQWAVFPRRGQLDVVAGEEGPSEDADEGAGEEQP